MFEIEKRSCKAHSGSYCRGCNKHILKDVEMIYTYSSRNRGQSIMFCLDCAKKIGDLANV